MRLDQIIQGIAIKDRRGRMDSEIPQIVFDSRKVEPGDLFVAIRGQKYDGHRYIRDAVKKGAAAVMAEEWPTDADGDKKPDVILVPDSRRGLALAAANFYGQPSRKLLISGVTGTNGKTTVTYLLESIIRAASRKVGLIGSVECRYAGKVLASQHTTPDPLFLESALREMKDSGVSHVVMEVSSHALDQQRVAGVHFKVAAFTNLSQDHLDYHASMEQYFESKSQLFSEVLRRSRARGRMAVINIDDPKGVELLDKWKGKTLRVSMSADNDAEVALVEADYRIDGTTAKVRTPKGVWEVETALIGEHNLSNALVATGMALAMGFSKARILRGLRALERVPGRLELIPSAESKRVFVDYAHTPDALKRVIAALRPLTKGKIGVVFGCGGDRDADKRPKMGKIVSELADYAIVTNDNPRSEDPSAIASAIEKGLTEGGWSKSSTASGAGKTYSVELDRRIAIRQGIASLGDEDILLIAGKGHENYQIIGTERRRFDDREEARRILANEPPPPPDRESLPPLPDGDDVEELSADDLEDITEAEEVGVSQVVDAVEVVGTTEILAEEVEAEDKAAKPAPDSEIEGRPPKEAETEET